MSPAYFFITEPAKQAPLNRGAIASLFNTAAKRCYTIKYIIDSRRDTDDQTYMQRYFFTRTEVRTRDRADLPVAQDLLDTLKAHETECVGMAANMIGVNLKGSLS